MLGAALLILISGLGENGFMDSVFSEDAMSMIGLVPLILLLGPAIALFIYSGTKMERYKYMESGFSLPYPLETYIEQRQSAFAATYTLSLIMGSVYAYCRRLLSLYLPPSEMNTAPMG
ncbi:hypothetical protein [Paenibacillus rhizoplanae]|uniref:hypothetical protein n=1 Tax=Paenibacillus rhizoplanae TaxID=1917181 RepID=UPI00361C1BC5